MAPPQDLRRLLKKVSEVEEGLSSLSSGQTTKPYW